MRGVNLDLFDFDYDLTWMGFFLSADETVLGRYGGRDAESADGRVSLGGLRYAMQAALARHQLGQLTSPLPKRPLRAAEQLSAAVRLPEKACIHCHQVYDLRRESLQAAGKWTIEELWVYPLPENVGLTLETERGNVVAQVAPDSPAERVGLRKADRLRTLNGISVASFGDVQYALHRAPALGRVPLTWLRSGQEMSGELVLPEGWRKTDLSWRWSLRGLDPAPWVQGEDLNPQEKKALGLAPNRLAFRQGPFVMPPAEQAGIRQNDVILGIDGKVLEMTARQFGAYIRLHYKVGDTVTYNILRGQRCLDLKMTLPRRSP
jgi:hypothetical protein